MALALSVSPAVLPPPSTLPLTARSRPRWSTDSITQVLGALNGIKGVLDDNLIDMGKEDPAELALMKYTPSSALGSCRYKLKDPDVDDTDYKRILEIFKKYDVRYFFYNGGNDSMDTCNKISKYMLKNGYECRVMGIPKTIDNDLYGTDHCPGYAFCGEVHRDVRDGSVQGFAPCMTPA